MTPTAWCATIIAVTEVQTGRRRLFARRHLGRHQQRAAPDHDNIVGLKPAAWFAQTPLTIRMVLFDHFGHGTGQKTMGRTLLIGIGGGVNPSLTQPGGTAHVLDGDPAHRLRPNGAWVQSAGRAPSLTTASLTEGLATSAHRSGRSSKQRRPMPYLELSCWRSSPRPVGLIDDQNVNISA
jgi:hypothetical protein